MTVLAVILGIIVFFLAYIIGTFIFAAISALLLYIPIIKTLFRFLLISRGDSASTFAVSIGAFLAALLTQLVIQKLCQKRGNALIASRICGSVIILFAIYSLFNGGGVFPCLFLIFIAVIYFLIAPARID